MSAKSLLEPKAQNPTEPSKNLGLGAMIRSAFVLFILLSALLGLLYPVVTTWIGEGLFPHQAHGSLITKDKVVIGSALVAQKFESPRYFHPRPSYAGDGYDAANSSGSNLAPSNPDLIDAVKKRVEAIKAANPDAKGLVPQSLVTASGSGLDPDISLAAAYYQVPRIAKSRQLTEEAVKQVIDSLASQPVASLGESKVNVLLLNLKLDQLQSK